MATVVSTPITAFGATLVAGTAMGQSANLTIAVNITGAFEANIAFKGVQPNTANISAGWEAYAYRTTDNGTSYETQTIYGRSIARNPNVSDQVAINLPRGQYLLRIISGGNVASTYSFLIGTYDIGTAVANT